MKQQVRSLENSLDCNQILKAMDGINYFVGSFSESNIVVVLNN